MQHKTIILALLSASATAMPHLTPRQSRSECQTACDAFCDGTGPNPNKGFLIWDIDDPCHNHRFWSCAFDKNRPAHHQWYCLIGD
ncbi:hypothetical protein BDR22DRAFT_867561 [Usnea florida]